MASLGPLLVRRNCWSLHRQPMSSIFGTMRPISYVCGSLVNANWISSRSGIHMSSLRALPIKSILEQRSIATHMGSRSITRQAGGILPGSFSCTLRQRVQLREMPPLCDYSRGSVFVLTGGGWAAWRHHASSFHGGRGERHWSTCVGNKASWHGDPIWVSSGTEGSPHRADQRKKPETSSWGFVCTVSTILATAHAAQAMPFLGSGAAATYSSTCPMGWCY